MVMALYGAKCVKSSKKVRVVHKVLNTHTKIFGWGQINKCHHKIFLKTKVFLQNYNVEHLSAFNLYKFLMTGKTFLKLTGVLLTF